MKRRELLAALVAMALVCTSAGAQAATILMSIDGVSPVETIPTFTNPDGTIEIGTNGGGYFFSNANGSIFLSGVLDPDPSIIFAGGATDLGAPSNFSITIILPLVPVVNNPSFVQDSLQGGVFNAQGSNVKLTANAPPAGIPEDDDGDIEMQVFTLSANGTDWQNVGLDAGLTEEHIIPVGDSADTLTYNSALIPTIAGGPWTHMRMDLNFGLTGFGDGFNFTGSKTLVPEPGTILLALMSLAAACMCNRRFAR